MVHRSALLSMVVFQLDAGRVLGFAAANFVVPFFMVSRIMAILYLVSKHPQFVRTNVRVMRHGSD